jgi:hypothetical protein
METFKREVKCKRFGWCSSDKKISAIKAEADVVVLLKNVEEAKEKFQGFLPKLIAANIKYNGFYSCVLDGKKTFVQLA